MIADTNRSRELILYRRLFHRHPEPGWLGFFATVFIADRLEKNGYRVLAGRELLGDDPILDPPSEGQIDAYQRQARKWLEEIRQVKSLWTDQNAGPDESEHDRKSQAHDGRTDFPDTASWMRRMDRLPGVLAVLEPEGGYDRTLMFRFDMDALPVEESRLSQRVPVRNGFSSLNEGVSHACGHDGHIAAGLVLAELLAKARDNHTESEGAAKTRYVMLFQPAEEGVRGAAAIVKRLPEVLPGKIDRFFAGHIGFTEEGTFVAGCGGFLATTKLNIRFTGKSAHAGLAPERGRNALLAAVYAMSDMQKIHRPDTEGITRLNVGKLDGGEARNAIPAHALMQMETRGSSRKLNEYMRNQAIHCAEEAAARCRVRYQVSCVGTSVSAESSPQIAGEAYDYVRRKKLFPECVMHQNFGSSEDAAILMDYVQEHGGQAAYFLFGARLRAENHESDFDFSEDVLLKMLKIYYHMSQI